MAHRFPPAAAGQTASIRPVAWAVRCALAAMACAVASAAHAQTPAAAPAPAVRVPADKDWHIGAGALDAALADFAAQAGVSIITPPAWVQGKTTQGLQGLHGVREGLTLLLAGTGLQAVQSADNAFVVRALPAATNVDAANSAAMGATLPVVMVTAQAVQDGTTEGTASYTQTGPSGAATGLALSLRETPQSVSVMTRQRMDDFKLETLTDVLEQTPGVSIERQSERNTFYVRGSAVNLQIDGARRISTGWGWNSHIVHSMDDLAEIDRVEVLKGSSGLMNGDGSYGATVNLIRKRPTGEFQGSAAVSAGSWDTYRLDADVSGPLNADASLRGRLVAAHRQSDSFNGKRSESDMLYGTLEYDLSASTVLGVGLTWRQREQRGAAGTTPIQGFAGDGTPVPLMPRNYNNGAPWAGYEQDALNTFVRLEHRFDNGWSAKIQATHDAIDTPEMRIGSLRFALPEVAPQVGMYKDIASRDRGLTMELQGPFSLFGREHQLLLGAGTASHRTTLLRGTSPDPDLTGIDYAQGGRAVPYTGADAAYSSDLFSSDRSYVYAASRLTLADPVKLIAGARVTDYRQKDMTDISWYQYDFKQKGVVTPYAGLVVDVAKDVSVYTSYTSIFNPSGAKDIHGRALDPEEGKTYEIGAKGEFFNKRLNASVSHFWMRTDNTPEEAGMNAYGDVFYQAVSGASRRGYELELSGELARGWQAQGSYVQNSSDLSSASSLPAHQFKLGTTYQFGAGALSGLTVGAATRWQSAISVSGANATLRQDAYWLFDLMARYQVSPKLSISANLNNVFDKAYFSAVTNFNRQGLFYTWGAPRSVSVSARYTF